jgi:hypothetical protein
MQSSMRIVVSTHTTTTCGNAPVVHAAADIRRCLLAMPCLHAGGNMHTSGAAGLTQVRAAGMLSTCNKSLTLSSAKPPITRAE